MVLSNIQAVVFDAVGTLIHPEPPAPLVYAAVGARFGSRLTPHTIAGRFAAAFQREEDADLAAGLRTSEDREQERWRGIVAAVLDDVTDPEACFGDLYHHFSRSEAWRCEPAAVATLKQLTRLGYRLGLASNYDARLRGVLAGLSILPPIAHLVISSEIGWRKPAPAFFARVCQELALPADHVLYVGDDLVNDYAAAGAAGLRAILFDPENQAPPNVIRINRLKSLLVTT
jgi:putative hydrolase of the HAD superfamily